MLHNPEAGPHITNCSEVLSPIILTIKWKDSKSLPCLKLPIYLAKPYPNANPIGNDQFI